MRSISLALDRPPARLRHETRTQLTIIRGYAQLAQRRLRDERSSRLEVWRALVAIEQASRALEAGLELGRRERD